MSRPRLRWSLVRVTLRYPTSGSIWLNASANLRYIFRGEQHGPATHVFGLPLRLPWLRLTTPSLWGGWHQQSALFIASTHHAAGSTLAAALAIITSLALMIGLMTPIATALLCLGGLAATIDSEIVGYMPPFESWIARFEFIVMSAALICLGPGAFSLDARLYGRREIDVNGNGS